MTMRYPADLRDVEMPRGARELVIASSIGSITPEIETLTLNGDTVVLRNMHGEVSGLMASIGALGSGISSITVMSTTTPNYGSANSSGIAHLKSQAAQAATVDEDLHFKVNSMLVNPGKWQAASAAARQILVVATPTMISYGRQRSVLNTGMAYGMRMVGERNADYMHAFDMREIARDLTELLMPVSSGGKVGIRDVRVPAMSEAENTLIERRADHIGDLLAGYAKIEIRSLDPVDLRAFGSMQRKVALGAETIRDGTIVITKIPVKGRHRVR